MLRNKNGKEKQTKQYFMGCSEKCTSPDQKKKKKKPT